MRTEATGERFTRAGCYRFGMSLMLSLFTLFLWGGGLVVWLLLLWKAYQGETLSLPVIGAIAREQAGNSRRFRIQFKENFHD